MRDGGTAQPVSELMSPPDGRNFKTDHWSRSPLKFRVRVGTRRPPAGSLLPPGARPGAGRRGPYRRGPGLRRRPGRTVGTE
eukprot:355296-Hanusia_phi.AAC.1